MSEDERRQGKPTRIGVAPAVAGGRVPRMVTATDTSGTFAVPPFEEDDPELAGGPGRPEIKRTIVASHFGAAPVPDAREAADEIPSGPARPQAKPTMVASRFGGLVPPGERDRPAPPPAKAPPAKAPPAKAPPARAPNAAASEEPEIAGGPARPEIKQTMVASRFGGVARTEEPEIAGGPARPEIKRTMVAPRGKMPGPPPPAPPPGSSSAALAGPPAEPPADPPVETPAEPPSEATAPAEDAAEASGTHGLQQERTRLRLIAGKVVPGTRYKLVRWLGEGGMGVVYQAEHVDIERKVALKILRFDLSQQPEMSQVFRDEARAASRTGHPNIVEIYDFGELPDGRLFLCMELLDGKDLVPATETDACPPATVIAILRQLCKGLAAAHKAGIVHRDIKPENIILVNKGGRDGVVKIVDFGISAMLAAGQKTQRKIAGTPQYMAPEQIGAKPFDGRLDQYAVGCVAYELLTGRPPFNSDVVEEVLVAQIEHAPVPPSQARPDLTIPPALEQVVLRCLSKKADERYPDMHELEAALCEAQIAAGIRTAWDDLPLPELPPDRLEKLRARMPSPQEVAGRRRWLWPAIAAASTFAAMGAIAYAVFSGDPNAEERAAVDRLAEEALVAASRTFYVAPPPGEPESPTAYKKVLELEALAGAAEKLADERAAGLREQFAAGLVALGDKYWEVSGARPFAVEYYIWARVFEPDNKRAIDRSFMTYGAFSQFQDKAATGAFSLGELRALGLVSAFADPDEERRNARVGEAVADAKDLSIREQVTLGETLRGAGVALPEPPAEPAPAAPPEPEPPAEPPPQPEAESTGDAPEPEAEPEPEPTPKGKHRPSSGGNKAEAKNKRDPARAKDLADEGAAALKAGKRSDAEGLFHQAISFDNRNAKALMGLSDIYFDTGAKQKAVQFAELAVEAAPKSMAYHLKLGDAYFAVLRYRDALKQYEKAKELGDDGAQGRIDKVKKLIGD